jgi:hypothetical protein
MLSVLNVKALKVYTIKEWIVINEFYELLEKARFLLLSSTSLDDLNTAKHAVDDMVKFLLLEILKKEIALDDLSQFEIPLNYRKVQPEEGYNSTYYQTMCSSYRLHANLFNYIVDGRYKEFRERNKNW